MMDFIIHHTFEKIQLCDTENDEELSRTNREIEILDFGEDSGAVGQNGYHHSIPRKILHKKHFLRFFRKIRSVMSCRELQVDFDIPAEF